MLTMILFPRVKQAVDVTDAHVCIAKRLKITAALHYTQTPLYVSATLHTEISFDLTSLAFYPKESEPQTFCLIPHINGGPAARDLSV